MKVGFWQRVLALTIDEILLVGVTALALARLDRFDMFHSWWTRILFYELIDYNYYTLCWRFGGQTVGKRIMRAKVVRMDGSPLSYWDAVVRYWVWMVGMALAGIGYFW
ncbi:MAG: RDD family protein, partial [Alicyclobacillus macrosporangiidus]|uniref:RDD family protein n=1 Tax=Alicyclobacillus macrosporangiidus TaxID=392015 RepID=UPI0026F11249